MDVGRCVHALMTAIVAGLLAAVMVVAVAGIVGAWLIIGVAVLVFVAVGAPAFVIVYQALEFYGKAVEKMEDELAGSDLDDETRERVRQKRRIRIGKKREEVLIDPDHGEIVIKNGKIVWRPTIYSLPAKFVCILKYACRAFWKRLKP